MKKAFLLVLIIFMGSISYASDCSCSKDGVSYTWGTSDGIGCGKATGKATKSENGKVVAIVEAQEAIDACW